MTGNEVTYTIIYTDGTTSTFTVKNGEDGHSPEISIDSNGYWCVDGTSLGIKAKGDNGEDGKGISGVTSGYDENGNTLITILFTDGTNQVVTLKKGDKGDTGAQGEKGDTGPQGDKGDTGDKGADGQSIITGKGKPSDDVGNDGDSYVDTDTWDYYIKTDETWSLTGNIKGNKGDKGDTGAQGDKGDKGDTGSQGEKGDKGDTGAQGEKGDKGDKGDTGAQGEKGDKGDDAITYVPVIFNNWDG